MSSLSPFDREWMYRTFFWSGRIQMSLESDATGLKLSGDEASPGNSKYYGTNSSGVKGYHALGSGGGAGYTDEEAQDAVGTILVDSSTIDFTYSDATPSITADVIDGSITYTKMQSVSATDKLLGRASSGSGIVEEIACTAAGRALIGGADAASQRTTLGLGSMALAAAADYLTTSAAASGYQPLDSDLTSIAGLSDPNADCVLFWDDSAGAYAHLTIGSNLSITDATLDAAGGSASATTVEVDLGTPKFTGKFTITDAAITATSKILCWQAPGPYTGKGTRADEAEMQPVEIISVEPATGSAVVKWQTPPAYGVKVERQEGQRRNTVGATFDRVLNQRLPIAFSQVRLGKVRGNVKFSYTVFS